MSLKVVHVRLSDVESVTETLVKFDVPIEKLRSRKGKNSQSCFISIADFYVDALVLAEQLSKICSSWNNSAWDEIEWATRLKDIRLREILDTRKADQMMIKSSGCLLCPKFLKHFAMCRDEWLIKENITQLRQLMSDQNLQLLPDYEQRIQVLRDLDFIDEGSRVQLKGKVACEVQFIIILLLIKKT